MKQTLLILAAFVLLISCKKDESPDPVPENPDWYVLRAPDNRDIKAVHGNIDDTLVITTGFKIYITTDQGKNWTTTNYDARVGLFGFMEQQDTLFAMESQYGSGDALGNYFAGQPSSFSTDHGLTWERVRRRAAMDNWKVPINYAYSGNGIAFGIDIVQSGSYLRTVGIKSESGRKISLPAHHQFINVYFDPQSRLYVAGSAPICGEGEDFKYCNAPNGTVYVSKRAVLF
nr:hypothetical protein [uncultured Dyadobacter sp.]